MRAALDWALLFRAEAPRLRRFLRRFGPQVSPEDLVQESFAKLCAADETTISSPRAYLYRTARNLALNELRHQRSVPVLEGIDPDEVDSGCLPGPEETLAENERMSAFNAALDALAPHLRQALVLARLERMHETEIAKRMGISRRTVQRYVAQALLECHIAMSPYRDGD